MQLEYLVKDSVFVSKDKWGKYLEGYFIDTDNTKRPIELNFDLVPHGFNTQVCIKIFTYIYQVGYMLSNYKLYFCTGKHI